MNYMVNEEDRSIEVKILNAKYDIKVPKNMSINELRDVAAHVDHLMREVNRKGYDSLGTAVLVALNLAAQRHQDRDVFKRKIQEIITGVDDIISSNEVPDDRIISIARDNVNR